MTSHFYIYAALPIENQINELDTTNFSMFHVGYITTTYLNSIFNTNIEKLLISHFGGLCGGIQYHLTPFVINIDGFIEPFFLKDEITKTLTTPYNYGLNTAFSICAPLFNKLNLQSGFGFQFSRLSGNGNINTSAFFWKTNLQFYIKNIIFNSSFSLSLFNDKTRWNQITFSFGLPI